MKSFFAELRRRNVFRVALAYLVTGWLLVEVASVVLPTFDAPGWVQKVVTFLIMLGFPLALIFAWAFELTPEGIKRDKDVDRSQSVTRGTGRKIDFAIIGLLSVALLYFVLQHDWVKDPDQPDLPGMVDSAESAVQTGAVAALPQGKPVVAVLPFKNMSDYKENAFFASGVHEDILTHLAKVGGLRVISRTSALQYQDHAPSGLKTIAAELGASHVVEGSVRREGDTVRISAQLIDASSDEHLWAQNYDRDLVNVFAIQSEVAQEIVKALNAELTPRERSAIGKTPSDSLAAYDLYLKGREIYYGADYGANQIRRAEPYLLEAVEIDPDFARAHALLGELHTHFYWLSVDRTPERLARARQAIDRSLALDPDLVEAQVAQAEYYYRGFRDFERARIELERARDRYPNSVDVLTSLGTTYRRLGEFDKAIEALRLAAQLDPASREISYLLCGTAIATRHWTLADDCSKRLIDRYPDEGNFYRLRADYLIVAHGDVDSAAAVIDRAPDAPTTDFVVTRAWLLAQQGRFDEADRYFTEHAGLFAGVPAYLAVMRSNTAVRNPDRDATRALYEDHARLLTKMLASGQAPPPAIAASSLANARIGELKKASELARSLIEMHPEQNDRFTSSFFVVMASIALGIAGEMEEALTHLERMALSDAGPTYWELKLDPMYDVFRGDPGFDALLVKTRKLVP